MEFGDKIKMAALGVALSGGALEAQETSKSPIPDVQTEKNTNYQEIYADKISQRNESIIELKNSLDKKGEEARTLALEIKNKINNPFNSNDQKLKDLMIVKFYNIDATNEYLSKILDIENRGLLEIFNDLPSRKMPDLSELNKPLMEYKNILDKIKALAQEIQNLASIADSNAPIAPDQIPTTIAGTNKTHSNVQFVQQTPIKKTFEPAPTNEIHLAREKQTAKVGEILKDLSYNLGKFGEGLKGILMTEKGCYICPPPGGEITR